VTADPISIPKVAKALCYIARDKELLVLTADQHAYGAASVTRMMPAPRLATVDG